MKILLAIDESPFSEEAIREVEERFALPHTTVRVLHAVAKFVPPAATLWYDAGGSLVAARAEVLTRYQELVGAVTERLTAQGLDAEALVKDGDPRSVTQYVLDHAPCSVEIARRKEPESNE